MTYDMQTIDDFLGPFIAGYRLGKSAASARRIDTIETLLRDCMEDAGFYRVCDDCREMLALERLLDPVGVFARTMGVECLVEVLFAFVHPPWLLRDASLQNAQWRFVAAALSALGRLGLHCSPETDRAFGSLIAHVDAALRGTPLPGHGGS